MLYIVYLGVSIADYDYIAYLLPYLLIVFFIAIFYTELTFFIVIAATPLSVNIEEWVDGFGLYLPTEPLLFGTMVILLLQSLRSRVFPDYLWRSPITITIILYLIWLFFMAIVSTNQIASFKFILARLWFIVPILFYGSSVYASRRNIRLFLWLFLSAMTIVIIYTLIHHASYRFAEKEGHWVMSPFFKDHTIYGAIVALTVPLIVAFYFSRKHNALIQFILLGILFITLLGLFFSYTRAAWLSLALAMGIWALVKYKVKFSIVAGVALVIGLYVWVSWDAIQQDLARNKYEHTTEEFGEKLQSATNVTTDASNLERINRWSCAISMFKEKPLTGFGPGTYAFEYARFQQPENLTIISTNFGDGGNAHSEYLGPLAETGLPGMLLVLAFVAAIFYQGIRVYYKISPEDKEWRTLVLGMLVSLGSYFIHGFLNNYLDSDKAAVPVWSMCAIFIAIDAQVSASRKEAVIS